MSAQKKYKKAYSYSGQVEKMLAKMEAEKISQEEREREVRRSRQLVDHDVVSTQGSISGPGDSITEVIELSKPEQAEVDTATQKFKQTTASLRHFSATGFCIQGSYWTALNCKTGYNRYGKTISRADYYLKEALMNPVAHSINLHQALKELRICLRFGRAYVERNSQKYINVELF